MTVREVVLHHDVRAPIDLSPRSLVKPHVLRRILSTLALMCIDGAALLLAVWATFALDRRIFSSDFVSPRAVDVMVGFLAMVAVFVLSGLYGRRGSRHGLLRTLRGGLSAAAVVAVIGLLTAAPLAPLSFAISWALALAILAAARLAYDAAVERSFGKSELSPVVLVGSCEGCIAAQDAIAASAWGDQYSILGMIAGRGNDDEDSQAALPALGAFDDLDKVLATTRAAELVVCDVALAREFMPHFLDVCRRHRVALKLAAVDLEFGPEAVTYIPGFDMPLFVVRRRKLNAAAYYMKRAADFVGGALLLVLLSPVLLALAAAIKSTSPGPVLFVDERIGLGQRRFRCYKFRTMRRDAARAAGRARDLNEADGAIFKIKDDPRVTAVGRFLRRSSLDELPQLFNVLKGDMSLVGPRPLPMRDFALLDDVHKQRHVVLPGLTGLWQVSGRSDISFDDMIALDLRYIETWSLASDAVIVLRTIGVVFGLKGAY